MILTTLDWAFVVSFFILSLGIGIWVARKGKNNVSEYFAAGQNMHGGC
jgi:SSS family solute:Na+ symporter